MNIALILAGGAGTRAGGSLPKQFQYIRGKRMIWWSVDVFRRFDPDCVVVLVVYPDHIQILESDIENEKRGERDALYITPGGSSRIESVRKGLAFLSGLGVEKNAKVFIHDGARPLLQVGMIDAGSHTVAKGVGAVPVVALTDSIREKRGEGTVAVPRENYMTVQTPQIFLYEDIKAAYENVIEDSSLTDDASVAERYGMEIATYQGDPMNIKVTYPVDFIIAENCGH